MIALWMRFFRILGKNIKFVGLKSCIFTQNRAFLN